MDERIIDLIKSGNYALIDVREEMELMMDGQLDEAKNIPLGQIPDAETEILAIEKPVILFCRSGNRSGKALEYLNSVGLKEGYNGGGYLDVKQVFESL